METILFVFLGVVTFYYVGMLNVLDRSKKEWKNFYAHLNVEINDVLFKIPWWIPFAHPYLSLELVPVPNGAWENGEIKTKLQDFETLGTAHKPKVVEFNRTGGRTYCVFLSPFCVDKDQINTADLIIAVLRMEKYKFLNKKG